MYTQFYQIIFYQRFLQVRVIQDDCLCYVMKTIKEYELVKTVTNKAVKYLFHREFYIRIAY